MPDCSDAPLGRLMPSAGKNACKSFAGRLCPSTLMCSTAPCSGISYVPERFSAAVPIFSTDGFKTPLFFVRSYLVLKFSSDGIGRRSSALRDQQQLSRALQFLFVSATPPCDATVASRSRMPPSPADGSRKPVEARFSELIVNFASSGVRTAFAGLCGPAVPSTLKLPPPGRSALTVNGNFEVRETFGKQRRSRCHTCCAFVIRVEPTVTFPFFNSSFATENWPPESPPPLDAGVDAGAAGFAAGGGAGGAPV